MDLNLPDQEFAEVNRRAVARLRRKHPDVSEGEVIAKLREAAKFMPHACKDRIIATASFIISDQSGRGRAL